MPSYLSRAASAAVILRHISSASASGLERKMLKIQSMLKAQVDWKNPTWVEKEQKWFVWYSIDFDEHPEINGGVNA